MKRTRIAVTVACLAIASSAFWSGRTERWTLSTPEEFQNGTLENIIVSSTGELTLGPSQTRVESSDLTLWCTATDETQGIIYFGSGTEGKVYALTAQKEMKEVAKTGELVVTALAFSADRKLYAATVPAGKIFLIDPTQATATAYATLPDAYVWSLAVQPDGALIAGTGPEGRVYKIAAKDDAKPLYETKQEHVLSLASTPQGIYAGTSPNGVLFRIAKDGTGDVVFNSDAQEIRALSWTRNALWIGANKVKKFDPKKFVKRLKAAAAQAESSEESESPFEDIFNGAVYRLTPNGSPRLIHAFEKSYLTSLVVEEGGTIYIGTGDEGRLWRLSADGTHALFAKVKEKQVMALALTNGQISAFGTGSAASVYTIATKAKAGSYTSEIKDAKVPAQWGTFSWEATAGPIAIQTRTGKTASPEEGTWSTWSEPLTANGLKVSSPAGRYFQFRVTWDQGSPAALRWTHVYYRTDNQQPTLKAVEIESFNMADAQQGKARETSEVSIKWKTEDTDGDDLTARLAIQSQGSEDWLSLVNEAITKKDYKWNTSQVADGWYRIRVTVSDASTNPAADALTASQVSIPILVDNTKPAFEHASLKDRNFSASVEDRTSVIVRIDFAVDDGAWQYIVPSDGLYDEKMEKVAFEVPAPAEAGLHQLSVRAFDAAGNVAAYQGVFRAE